MWLIVQKTIDNDIKKEKDNMKYSSLYSESMNDTNYIKLCQASVRA